MSWRFRPQMELLDDRALPSTTIVDGEQFTLTGDEGTALVTLTVIEDESGYEGLYRWHYDLENVDYGCTDCFPSQVFQVDASAVGGVQDLQSSLDWDGGVNVNPDGSGSIVWANDGPSGTHPQVFPGASAEFSFTTPPMPIGPGNGIFVDNNPFGDSADGELLAPAKGAKLDFANVTTGKAYEIRIKGEGGDPTPDLTAVQVSATATVAEIAEAVQNALEGIGYTVTRDGTKLTIGPPKGRTHLFMVTHKLTGDREYDPTLTGPSLIYSWGNPAYEVWYNGSQVRP